MSRELKIGDRVRVSEHYREEDYQPGDQGRVCWVVPASVSGRSVYVVAMDKDSSGLEGYFLAGEIEPDL
jgi:hypothetical protein